MYTSSPDKHSSLIKVYFYGLLLASSITRVTQGVCSTFGMQMTSTFFLQKTLYRHRLGFYENEKRKYFNFVSE